MSELDPKKKYRRMIKGFCGTDLGGKHKIARCPYIIVNGNGIVSRINKHEAKEHALFISECFNKNFATK